MSLKTMTDVNMTKNSFVIRPLSLVAIVTQTRKYIPLSQCDLEVREV
jgi:hypothetical protein